MEETEEKPESRIVRKIYRASAQWVNPQGGAIPVFTSLEAADAFYKLNSLNTNVDYEKPWGSHVYSYENAIKKGYYEPTPDNFEVPEQFISLGSIIAAERRNSLIAYFYSNRDVEIHRRLKGKMITKYTVPVLELIKNLE